MVSAWTDLGVCGDVRVQPHTFYNQAFYTKEDLELIMNSFILKFYKMQMHE